MRQKQISVTVVVPVYNGELYLERTLQSLADQDFNDFQVLLVNDSSTDRSQNILETYCIKDSRFLIVNTQQNLGDASSVLSYVKNSINSKYFLYSSQDDTFSNDWISKLVARAEELSADAVIPKVYCIYNENDPRNVYFDGFFWDQNVVLSGREAFELSAKWKIPGNALWKRSLLETYGFYDFAFNADEYTVRLYYLNSNRVAFANCTFYYSQSNPDSITKKFSSKWFRSPLVEIKLWKLSHDNDCPKELQHYLIKRALRNILYFYPYTLTPKYFRYRSDLAECLKECQTTGLVSYLNHAKPAKMRLERIILVSRVGKLLLSLIMLIARGSLFRPKLEK